MTTRPSNRRHSLSTLVYRHKPIPHSETSHPGDPIPREPQGGLKTMRDMSPQLQAQLDVGSPRSSGESLGDMSNDTSDSETPSTPLTEHDSSNEERFDKLPSMQSSPQREKKRRASTTYVSSSEEIKRLLGDGNGTKMLEKFCCGEGCCKLEAIPLSHAKLGFRPIVRPDNAAFRFINPSLGALTLDTPLTKVIDLPESKTSFGSLRRQSIAEKFPGEEHGHDAASVRTRAPEYMKPHPPYDIYSAPVYGARELTKPGAEKRTFHFDLDVTEYPEEGGVDFKVGGAVGICPPNDPDVVDAILDQLGMPRMVRDRPIRLHTTGGRWPTIWGDEGARELVTTRREVLTWTVDISSSAPTKPLFRVLAEYATEESERQILRYMCSAQGQSAFCDLRTGPHITLQQLLEAFPSSKPPLEALLPSLTQLMPRFYSLSNDPHVSSDREGLAGRRLIEVAVTVHETQTHTGDKRSGVGSGFLERIAMQYIEAEKQAGSTSTPGIAGRALNLRVPMFRGLMSNPLSREFASDGPMMLIGAGVGMAPFRGFILNRLKNANCANKIWLVQGVRDSMLDEIYQGELGAHEKEIKKVVQSRAAPPPDTQLPVDSASDETLAVKEHRSERKVAKYVQDEVRTQADIVWFVINALDGRIFVCGSTKGMGEGVERALMDVAIDKGGLDEKTAKEFWDQKKKDGQYIAETW
ncbi:hypothetical protein B0A48_15864 [Cryoendolithus antarcticus]|uniref:FAD-binding FR-type domain-containing protein n=1 Tax=Cryoendolithus antarcticus TaxID=1507870 RepID=A0A1V8SIA9_9PEZI|nr:hypothetical protein B0A48_15864 [Cryoendolithus antarcticus]